MASASARERGCCKHMVFMSCSAVVLDSVYWKILFKLLVSERLCFIVMGKKKCITELDSFIAVKSTLQFGV